MEGDRRILTLILALGALFVTCLSAFTLDLPFFFLELGILLLSLILVGAGFWFTYSRKKKRLGWKFLVFFFSLSLINTVLLFYLQPHTMIIFLSVLSSTGYILVLDAIYGGKMVFDTLDVELDLSFQKKQKLGVLGEKREEFFKRIEDERRKMHDWTPSHITTEEVAPAEVVQEKKKNVEVYDSGIEEVTLQDVKDGEPKFVAAKKSSRFHVPSCRWLDNLRATDTIHFSSKEEAMEQGLHPCSCVDSAK